MFKKYLLLFVVLITSSVYGIASAEPTGKLGNPTIMEALIGGNGEDILSGNADVTDDTVDGLASLTGIFIWIKDTLSGFLLLIAVAVFLYIGIKLASSRGDPESFKKAMVHFVYAVIGIFIIGLAWALVTLISGINI